MWTRKPGARRSKVGILPDGLRPHHKKAAIAALILVSAIALAFLVNHLFFPGKTGETVHLVIKKGESLGSVAGRLRREGVIRSSLLLRIYAVMKGGDRVILHGHYLFEKGMRYGEVLDLLAKGPNYQVRVTVPEGLTLRQTAERLSSALGFSVGDFLAECHSTLHPVSFLEGRDVTLEGFLFPKTYEIPPDASPGEVVEMMLKQFEREVAGLKWEKAKDLGLSPYEIVIVASMVEKEAKLDAERPLVAAVIYNRLRLGMPLQIDATVQYALPEWKPRLTYQDLQVDSPYNTYRRKGLPPGPICSPGKSSLMAALEPAPVDYLYYVATGDGGHFFTSDYGEFLEAKRRYQP
jgi:UPF0755 protein